MVLIRCTPRIPIVLRHCYESCIHSWDRARQYESLSWESPHTTNFYISLKGFVHLLPCGEPPHCIPKRRFDADGSGTIEGLWTEGGTEVEGDLLDDILVSVDDVDEDFDVVFFVLSRAGLFASSGGYFFIGVSHDE
jgi:hypothetical protein